MSEGNEKKRKRQDLWLSECQWRGHTISGDGGMRRGNGNNNCQQKVPDGLNLSDALAFGLSFAWPGEGQQICGENLRENRFRAHYGPCPRAVKFLITLMKIYQPDEKIDLYLFSWLCAGSINMTAISSMW